VWRGTRSPIFIRKIEWPTRDSRFLHLYSWGSFHLISSSSSITSPLVIRRAPYIKLHGHIAPTSGPADRKFVVSSANRVFDLLRHWSRDVIVKIGLILRPPRNPSTNPASDSSIHQSNRPTHLSLLRSVQSPCIASCIAVRPSRISDGDAVSVWLPRRCIDSGWSDTV